MDLETLRSKALGSQRKRKANEITTTDEGTSNSSMQVNDAEEGEIVVGRVPMTLSATTAGDAAMNEAQLDGAALKRVAHEREEEELNREVLAIKEESKIIIAQLVRLGISPGYITSRGCSRDIIEISFHELGFPPPLLDQPSTPTYTHRDGMQFNATSDDTKTPQGHLASLEQQKRDELLARKALTAARNEEKAQSLVSELENLISLDSVALPPTVDQSPAEANVSLEGRNKASLRTAGIDPPIYSAETYSDKSQKRRPLAIDFEGASSANARFKRPESQRLVIDISDDEIEDEVESHDFLVPTPTSTEPVQPGLSSLSHSRLPLVNVPAATVAAAAAAAAAAGAEAATEGGTKAEAEAKQKLEAKETEIRRVMARIARLEKKSTRLRTSRPPSAAPSTTSESVLEPVEAVDPDHQLESATVKPGPRAQSEESNGAGFAESRAVSGT